MYLTIPYRKRNKTIVSPFLFDPTVSSIRCQKNRLWHDRTRHSPMYGFINTKIKKKKKTL